MKLSLSRLGWGIRDAVRSQLWPIPVAAVVVAVVLGVVVPLIDRQVDGRLPNWLDTAVFSGDPDAARTVLDAVGSSLITVTSLTFSLTVVTLQLASSQFSPRLLRTFTQDLFVQVTLGLFLATFVYSLTVLRSVRNGSGDSRADNVVPRLAVTFSFLLAVASVVALILFLAHLTRQIRVETMVNTVRCDAVDTIEAVLDHRPDSEEVAPLPVAPAHAVPVLASSSGFYLSCDALQVQSAAEQADAVVRIEVLPGSYVVEGTPIGRLWSVAGGQLDDERRAAVCDAVGGAIEVGRERTAGQDIAFGLRQLTDVVNKALSPGVNDPTTAVHALGHVSTVLCELADRQLGSVVFRDEDQRIRVGVQRPGLDELLDVALGQPRHYGSTDLQVMSRLLTVLRDVAWHVRPDDRSAVRIELDATRETIAKQDYTERERDRLQTLVSEVEAFLEHRLVDRTDSAVAQF